MASTYGNDLRLEEIGDGEQSGTWGATTNTNLELIAEALSFGTEAITTNADTHTTTIADGATDPGRSLYLKYTGTLDSTCTITIAPNSISKTWYIENGTSGSQSIIISQGSGANVTIPTGQTKIVYSDGAGSGAAMAEIGTLGVTNLNVSGVLTGASLDISGDIDVDGTTNLDAVDIDGAVDMASTLLVAGVLTANAGAVFNEGSADVDFRVESNGNANMLFVDGGNDAVVIGHNDATNGTFASSQALQVVGTSFTTSSLGLGRFSADANGPSISLSKSRAAGIGTDTVIQDNDNLGNILFTGSDGTDLATQGASINAQVDGTPGGNDMPTRLTFATTSDGSSSPTERMRIGATGAVTMTGAVKPLTYQETYVASSAASTVTLDLATATSFSLTMGQATTFAFSNPPSSGTAFSFTLFLTQHSSAVAITWPNTVDWAGGSAPDAALANEVQAYAFFTRDGGTTYYGFLGGTAIA